MSDMRKIKSVRHEENKKCQTWRELGNLLHAVRIRKCQTWFCELGERCQTLIVDSSKGVRHAFHGGLPDVKISRE